jgi:hypothetical protein
MLAVAILLDKRIELTVVLIAGIGPHAVIITIEQE